MSASLYQEELIDHFKFPRNKKTLNNPDFSAGERNPSCGDKIFIEGKISNKTISELGFSGKGCILSQATTSMLTEECVGKSFDYVHNLSKNDILKLVGFSLGPNRMRCALLCLEVLHQGLISFQQNKKVKNVP